MATGSQAWFWFPDRRTGLVYGNEPAGRESCVLRTEQGTGAKWVVQVARPGSRLMCFDAPASQAAQRFRFAAAATGDAIRLDPLLVPRVPNLPGIVAIPPDGWDAATIAWLTKSPERLRVRRLTTSGVANPKAISARDVGAPIAELADAALSFSIGDRIGPAVRPAFVAEKPRVQVTFPPRAAQSGFEITVQLLDNVLQEVTIDLLWRDQQKKTRITRAQTIKLGPQSARGAFVLRSADVGYGAELYVQAAANVDLCYRDENGARVSAGSVLARKRVLQGLSVLELDAARREALQTRDVAGIDQAPSIRDDLLQRCGLAGLKDAAGPMDEIPAPLFAALLDHATQATGDPLTAADEFLHWPAAAQLRLSLGRNASRAGEARNGEDAASVVWRGARVEGATLGWLSADPQRQIAILPLLAQLDDAPRVLDAVQRIRNVASHQLVDTIKALTAIEDPAWARLIALAREGGGLRKRGDDLLAECRTAANDYDDICDRLDRLEQYERDARVRLGELAQARRRFEHYAGEIAAASAEFAQSRGGGLAAFESLAEKYRRAAGDREDEPAVAALAREFENGTTAIFAFDDDALHALARERWEDRKRQAEVIRWFEQLIALLGPERGATEVPAWPDQTMADAPLAPRVNRIEQRLSDAAPRGAGEKTAGLASALLAEARRLSAVLHSGLKRSHRTIAAMHAIEFGLDTLHARIERCADAIVLGCLRNALHARHDALLARGAAIANERIERTMREARSAAAPVASAATLNAWSEILSRLEQEIVAAERLDSELQALREQLSPPLRERMAQGIGPDLRDHVDAEIATWRAQMEAARARLMRAQAYGQALGGRDLSLQLLSEPQLSAEADDPHHLNFLLAWSHHRTQQLAKLGAMRAPLADLARAALTTGCPHVSWDEDAGERVAVALIAADGEPAEVHRSFAKNLGLLNDAWTMTGGSNPQLRALLWLRHDHPSIRGIEALIAMAKQPEQLVNSVPGATLEPKPAFTNSANFKRFIGDVACLRLGRLAKDDRADAMRVSNTYKIAAANTFFKAIPVVCKLVELARNSGDGMSSAEAATLQAVLTRHQLWPILDDPSGNARASCNQPGRPP